MRFVVRRSKLRRALSSPYSPLVSFWGFFLVERLCDPPAHVAYALIGVLFVLAAIGMYLNHVEIRALCAHAECLREKWRRDAERG